MERAGPRWWLDGDEGEGGRGEGAKSFEIFVDGTKVCGLFALFVGELDEVMW